MRNEWYQSVGRQRRDPWFHTINYIPEGGDHGYGRFETTFEDGSIGVYHPRTPNEVGQGSAKKGRHNSCHAKGADLTSSNRNLPGALPESARDHVEPTSVLKKPDHYMNGFSEIQGNE